MKKSCLLFILLSVSIFAAPPVLVFKNSAQAWKILKKDNSSIQCRSAYIYLTNDTQEKEKAWTWALTSSDPVLRRDAVGAYFRYKGDQAARKMLVMKPEKEKMVLEVLTQVIRQVKDTELRRNLAKTVITRPTVQAKEGELYRMNVRLKDDLTYDHEVETFQKISLASEQWKILADPDNQGVKNKYFAEDFDDRQWKPITVDKQWEVQGLPDYNGYAWYRVTFKAPEKKNAEGAEFYFPLVDEEAWIWLNGTYLGQRADGPDAWNKPFYMDATREIRWGKLNQLTIRVFDSDKAGGICKPPVLHLLR